ncbi:GNAT family N-acetyltransferase [Campylobacter sp. FMV-PI01]|uniref:GNAT family N-acetyltransferase n=1 Tax=Campylobacter portucalensis TaxID=2608384 RepID=A0A6L5WMD9_9BACT|nr:GNAT family N-acetyltransferase [Campylobacter portucalensis]MSN96993.1 GNAT family N-acetyltransferase [Campylobacter portucalensis]
MIRSANFNDVMASFEILELAMSDFSDAIFGTNDKILKFDLYKKFFRAKNNRLSHENVFIYENEMGEICGAICLYNGYDSDFLDLVFNQRLKSIKAKNLIKKECEDDEFYIDSVAVLPKFRGLGYFKDMMNYAILKAKNLGFKKVSLITQTPNYYTNFGFKVVKNDVFYGEIYIKMVKNI